MSARSGCPQPRRRGRSRRALISMQTGIRRGNLGLNVDEEESRSASSSSGSNGKRRIECPRRNVFERTDDVPTTSRRRPLIRVIILAGYSCLLRWLFQNRASQVERDPRHAAVLSHFCFISSREFTSNVCILPDRLLNLTIEQASAGTTVFSSRTRLRASLNICEFIPIVGRMITSRLTDTVDNCNYSPEVCFAVRREVGVILFGNRGSETNLRVYFLLKE